MSDFSDIFINEPALPGSNIYKKAINPNKLESWCEAVELGIKTDAEHIAKALTLINKMSDIIDQLGDSVKVLSDRVVELQTVCKYLDDRVQKLEAQKDS